MKNFIGKEGFVWWIGVVEDRNDPEFLGRVRVRCFGWHNDDKALLPTEALPWAHPVLPPNSPATYTPKEGDYVLGFFMDSDNAQNPVILGVLPGKPISKPDFEKGFSDPRKDFGAAPQKETYPLGSRINEPTTSRLARNRPDGTVIEKRKRSVLKGVATAGGATWDEPDPRYNPTYPYNYAHESESGHAFELDDTFGNERVHLAHKMGTFMEYDNTGSKVEKVIKDNYSLTIGNEYIYVEGTCNITVIGNCNVKVGGKLNVEAASIDMSAAGDVKIKAGASLKLESGSTTDIKSGGPGKFSSGGPINLKGSTATLAGSTINLAGNVSNKVKIPPKTDKPGGIGKILPSGSGSDAAATGLPTPSAPATANGFRMAPNGSLVAAGAPVVSSFRSALAASPAFNGIDFGTVSGSVASAAGGLNINSIAGAGIVGGVAGIAQTVTTAASDALSSVIQGNNFLGSLQALTSPGAIASLPISMSSAVSTITNSLGSISGKDILGITQSIPQISGIAKSAIATAQMTLQRTIPFLDLQTSMLEFEDVMNGISGYIQNLDIVDQVLIQTGCQEVVDLALAKEVVVSLVDTLLPRSEDRQEFTYETGKRLYPSTETVAIPVPEEPEPFVEPVQSTPVVEELPPEEPPTDELSE